MVELVEGQEIVTVLVNLFEEISIFKVRNTHGHCYQVPNELHFRIVTKAPPRNQFA